MNNFSEKQLLEIKSFFDSIQLEFLNVNDFVTDADWQAMNLKDAYHEINNFLEYDDAFGIEVIYYTNAIEYLMKHDASLSRSLELANELGYTTENLNSELLASLLATRLTIEAFCECQETINEFFENLKSDYEEALHQEARDLMDAINKAHDWNSLLSLDEYLFDHFDDLSQSEINDIKTLLDKFENL